MLGADSFYKKNIASRSDELSITPSLERGEGVVRQSNTLLSNISGIDSDKNKHYVYYISDIHLDHKIYKKFGKRGTLPKVVNYIEAIVDGLLKDDNGQDIYFPMDSTILITGDASHSFVINEIFYETLSRKLPYYRDVFVTLGNHELWEYGSVDEALLAYNGLFDRLPNIHLLHNSLYADNFYKSPSELNELYRQRWQVIKDKTITEKARRKALEINENEIDAIESRFGLTEEERHKGRVKANIISNDTLRDMTAKEIRDKCFDSKMIIFGAIGYSRYDEGFNASVGMYMNSITTRDQEERLSKETESIHNKLAESLPNNHLLIATHMPLSNWSKTQPQRGWAYFSGHTHKNQKILAESGSTSFADNQVGYYGKRIKFNLAITEGGVDYFAYYQDGIYDIGEKDYFNFYWNTSKIMSSIDKRGSKKIKMKMLKNSGLYMFLLETENGKLYLLEGGKRHKLRIQDVNYYYDNLVLLNKTVSEAVSGIRTYLSQLASFIKQIGGSGHIHGNIVDIDFYNHIMIDIRDGSMLPYFAYSVADRFEYPNLPKLLHDNRRDLYTNFLEYNGDLPVISKNCQVSVAIKHSADATIYKDSNMMLKIQDMLDHNVIRFWNDELMESIENERQLKEGEKLLS